MMEPSSAVFVFTRDGDVELFLSLDSAASYMEAIDVEAGEYTDVFTVEGERVDLSLVGSTPRLTLTGEFDEASLRRLLRRDRERSHLDSLPDDPRGYANELLRLGWERRWPKRPRWLSRRWHGDGPQQI